jgi:hypothetical protein
MASASRSSIRRSFPGEDRMGDQHDAYSHRRLLTLERRSMPLTPPDDPGAVPQHSAPAPMRYSKVFEIDMEHCSQSGGTLKIIAAIEHPSAAKPDG